MVGMDDAAAIAHSLHRAQKGVVTLKILEHSDPAACTKQLKIEIQQDEVTSELDEVYQNFMLHANIPGFRKGKVPRKIAEMRYGKDLYNEAAGKAIEAAYKEAMDELDLKPVSQPQIDPVKEEGEENKEGDLFDKTKPIVFEAKVEYMPVPESVDYDGIHVEPGSNEVSEKEVNEVLQNMRERNASLLTIDDRPVSDNDFVTLSSKATVDGEPFPEATHDEVQVQIGSGRYIPGFEDQLRGMNVDEEKSFTLAIPDNHPVEAQRGKDAAFEIKVKQIQEQKLPELDDDFAKDLGAYETLDELKDRLREDLEKDLEQRRAREVLQGVREQLLEKNQIDVPPSMVERQNQYLQRMADADLRQYGSSLREATQRDEGLLAEYEKRAQDDVKISVLLKAIADEESLEVEDDEFAQFIQRAAQQHGAQPEWFLKRIQDNQMEDHFRQEALEEKVLNWLSEKAAPEAAEKKATKAKKTKKDKEASEENED